MHPTTQREHRLQAAPTSKPNPALELLYTGVSELLNSDAWQEALKFRHRFHTYSFRNVWLIYLQRPDASLVAGYKRWQQLGRQVRKGETSLAILAPIVRKVDEDSEEVRKVVGFRSARVFDVSQTEGEPLPEVPRPVLLEADSTVIREVLARAISFAMSRGFPVEERALRPGVLGRYSLVDTTITLQPDLPPLQKLKTLVHELAHAVLHGDMVPTEANRVRAELEAESCAFFVLYALGLDTSRYSFAYLASWTEEPEGLLEAGEVASRAADAMLTVLSPLADGETTVVSKD